MTLYNYKLFFFLIFLVKFLYPFFATQNILLCAERHTIYRTLVLLKAVDTLN